MQLIRIQNMPIQYQYQIQHGKLEAQKSQPLEPQMTIDKPRLETRSKNIEVRLNMDAMRTSMGMRGTMSYAQEFRDRGIQKAQKATSDMVQKGNQFAKFYDGVTIGQVMRSKVFEQPTTYHTYIPSVGPDISWEPPELDINYEPGSVSIDWQMMRHILDYVPGKFHMMITQYPRVDIEYIGGFNYVPPSADPSYSED